MFSSLAIMQVGSRCSADHESSFPSKGDLIKNGVTWGFFPHHSSTVLSQDRWMWGLLTDAQAASVAERTHMQKSTLVIYSLSFIKMVFALNFSDSE